MQKLSFSGRCDTYFKSRFTQHGAERLFERGIMPQVVERVVSDPQGVHLQSYENSNAKVHLGIRLHERKEDDELIAVITNQFGKVVTLYTEELVPRLEMFQKHYPNLDLFEMLGVEKPKWLQQNNLHKNKPAYKQCRQYSC